MLDFSQLQRLIAFESIIYILQTAKIRNHLLKQNRIACSDLNHFSKFFENEEYLVPFEHEKPYVNSFDKISIAK